jgi:DNA-binding CsgD family transcriptional regulator
LRSGSASDLVVGVSLTSHLDSEAYASRIRVEDGFDAVSIDPRRWPPHSAEGISVALVDRCPNSAAERSPSDRFRDQRGPAAVLLARDRAGASPAAPCGCCRLVGDDGDWPALLDALRAANLGRRGPLLDPFASLSKREREVFKLVALGYSIRDCAGQMAISESTAGNHKHRLMKKLGIRSSLDLVRLALRTGIVEA